ncbi:MAG TPA: hypothetical protein VEY12_00910 [Thermoplasmata archaeon]|nr:hypothetical protein [Thermoplasmata archaeon]
MQGVLATLVIGFVIRALGPGLGAILMAVPSKRATRAQLKKIYVLNEMGDMDGEYVLDPECPIDYNDFLKVLPDAGIGDHEALFVGEYVFTAFQSGKFVFVLLSRGQLGPEDMSWTATLLTAADAHLAAEAKTGAGPRTVESPKPSPEVEAGISDRQARLDAREKELARLEAQLQADEANLSGRGEELGRQKERLVSLADYVSQMQQSVAAGLERSRKSLEMTERISASTAESHNLADAKALADLRQQFDDERKALIRARDELESKFREASDKVHQLEAQGKETAEAIAKERAETAAREAEAERMRAAIDARVQDLSQRFATMAKERLMNSHKPATASPEAPGADLDSAKAELAKERKFLQRRAIEMLDREEKVRGRETALEEREATLARREQDLGARERALSKPAPPPPAPSGVDADEARKDIERRVKIIQQKALELLDREEKLRKRAAELQALEARLSGSVPAH